MAPVLWLFLVIFANKIIDGSKLNVPRVLLPIFNDFQSKFTLEANDGGCYKWSTTRGDIISIRQLDENEDFACSAKAEVSTVTKEDARNLAVVLAEDPNNGQILKCDIVVDVISSLSVTTTTRELFMEEVPELFQINAYDDQGNEFSTLEGVEFEWNIVAVGPKRDATVLRYLPFKDSPYETPGHVQQLEDEGKKGSMVLLEGVKTGSAKVTVRLPYPEYKHVETIEVVLSVIANLLLTPAEAYLMPGDSLVFRLYYMNNGRMDEIVLPDNQYYLESEDNQVALGKKKSNEVIALQGGKTRILLRNSNLKEDDPVVKLPSSVIHVVQPAYIVLAILPHRNWAVLVGDQHEIVAEIYSSSDHKLHVGPDVEVVAQVGDAFHVEERSRNGSWITGWGVKESRAPVQATLEAVVHPKLGRFNLEAPMVSQAEIYIYPRITITPPEVVLPWDPQTRPKYDIDLVARGGDGRFVWTSTDHTIGMVTQSGKARTISHGTFDVSAAMMRNHHNRQVVRFTILPPVRLEIAEFVMEAEIGVPIYVHIAMYAEKTDRENKTRTYVPFTRCQNLPFQVKQSDNKFFFNKSAVVPPVGVSCANVAMVGTSVGTSKITITYLQDGLVLEDSVTISAYNPLKLLQPERQVVLAVGSSVNLVFTGGPRPQMGRQSEHQRTVISDDEIIVQAEDITDRHQLPSEEHTAVWVLCRKLGETSVKLMISNTPSVPNCKSLGSTLVTKIICGKPRRVHLQPDIVLADPKSCPMDLNADRVVVPNHEDTKLDVVVQDELGRHFLNTSSLLYQWEAKPDDKVVFRSKDGVVMKHVTVGTVEICNKTQQIVKAPSDIGLVEVTTTVIGYKLSVLKKYQITPEWPEFMSGEERMDELPKITSTLGLYLVDDTVVSPNFTVVFNQPRNKRTVAVLHGSGYVELTLSADDIAKVEYVESVREIEITPMKSGDLTIQLTDLCLSAEPVFIKVRVVTVGKIEIEMTNKVEINHCISCTVRLYDEANELLDLGSVDHVDLRHRFSKNIANLGRMPRNADEPWPTGELQFVMTGVELGDGQLFFSFDNNGVELVSSPADFQVFPPLKISPRNGTLLVGASIQMILKGGPQPDTNIEFSVLSGSIAEIDSSGIVVGRSLGSTRVLARAIGVHPRTGEKIVFSEDTVDIQIIQMSGVKIASPLTKFRVGGSVPCWITGIPEQLSPLVLASFSDSTISYDWYFLDNDVSSINALFGSVGIIYKNEDRVSIRVTGLQPGKTKLGVNVTISGAKSNKLSIVYQSSVEMEVFEALKLVSPLSIVGKSLLMAKYSAVQLQTNLDQSCHLEFSFVDPGVGGTAVSAKNSTVSVNNVASVGETGLLQSYGTEGYATLLVKSVDELGLVQTLTYIVEVKPVHYMMLSVVANWRIHLDSSLRVLPLGTEFDLVAQFYDDIGNKFIAGPQLVKVRTNRLDLVRIKQFPHNATIRVITKKPGRTILKAWTDGVDNTADYVMVHAEEVVKPVVDYLASGDIMCLWSPVVTKHLQAGHWFTSDTSLITIDPSIDVAFVIGRSEGTVLLTHPFHSNAPLRMQVLPVADVLIFPDRLPFITNSPESPSYRAGVVLRSRMGPADKRNNLLQGWLCDRSFSRYMVPTPFRCFIAFTNQSIPLDANIVFNLKSSFHSEVGQYNCKVTPTGSNASEASTYVTNITLWAIADEGDVESTILEVPFVPGVYATPEVPVGDTGNVGALDVTGLNHILKQVRVHPADSSILYVDKGYFVEPTRKRFQVHLIDYHPKFADAEETMGIIINSPATDQTLKAMVKVSMKYRDDTCIGKSPIFRFVQRYKHAIIIVISMMIIFCITCYVYSRYMQPVVNVNVHPNRSLLGAGAASAAGPYPPSSTPLNRSNQSLSRLTPTSPICTNKLNCTCGPRIREPVYGDTSSFGVNTPELRRNRRFL